MHILSIMSHFLFYRHHIHQSDSLNCDLTETNTTDMDQYNPRHFSQSTFTDIYQLYYKNDGSFYCDRLHDASNTKLVMFIKPNSSFTSNLKDAALQAGTNENLLHLLDDTKSQLSMRNYTNKMIGNFSINLLDISFCV